MGLEKNSNTNINDINNKNVNTNKLDFLQKRNIFVKNTNKDKDIDNHNDYDNRDIKDKGFNDVGIFSKNANFFKDLYLKD
jgi:hypothetical protein